SRVGTPRPSTADRIRPEIACRRIATSPELPVFYRYTFFRLSPDDLTPPYWINMGAMAISTLAGARLIGGYQYKLTAENARRGNRGEKARTSLMIDQITEHQIREPANSKHV